MKRAFSLFKALFLSNLRSPSSIFWMMVFPILLLLILSSIFSNIQSSVSVRVGIVDESVTFKNTNADFSSYIVKALNELARPQGKKTAMLHLKSGKNANDLGEFLKDLKGEKLDAVIFIPKNFNTNIYSRLLKIPLKTEPPLITIYTRKNSQSSDIAFSILNSVISSFNKEFWKKSGRKFLTSKVEYISKNGSNFSYIDFLVPGIIIMTLMTVSLFGITDDMLVQREKKVLKRFFVSPITKADYLMASAVSTIVLEIVQILLLLIVGKFLGANLKINTISLSFLLYALITSLPLGFFVASISKSANAGNALANIFNFVFMFLGGLFFPIRNVPIAVKIISYSIPTTYLANGLRSMMGISYSLTPMYLNITVPSIWAIFMAIYSIKRFKWEV